MISLETLRCCPYFAQLYENQLNVYTSAARNMNTNRVIQIGVMELQALFQKDAKPEIVLLRCVSQAAIERLHAAWVQLAAASANGKGNSPKHLSESGWTCFNVPGLGVHCMSPGDSFGSTSLTMKVFDTDNPIDPDAHFEGVETLILGSVYGGQKCPQSPTSEYEVVPIGPYTYMACHHYSH